MAKYAGLFVIGKCLFEDVYKLTIPLEIKVHLTFHVSLLKPYYEDTLRSKQTNIVAFTGVGW